MTAAMSPAGSAAPDVKRLEFRIPISPTPSFFAQVRFFSYALRRLGPAYRNARLVITVGDCCDIERVRRENRWSEGFDIVWERVPDAIAKEFGIWGTANWRLNREAGDAEVIILSDADTVLLRDLDPLLSGLPATPPAIRGHMAHLPPPVTGVDAPPGASPSFWPWLFRRFGLEPATQTHAYSMDRTGILPRAPAYFNLGFVAMNAAALPILGAAIDEVERRIKALTQSHMRCQIALTIIAHRAGMDIGVLPATYNTANDPRHLAANGVAVDDIRVLHYLRGDEIDRSSILLPEAIDGFLARPLRNPVNMVLQDLARGYRETLT